MKKEYSSHKSLLFNLKSSEEFQEKEKSIPNKIKEFSESKKNQISLKRLELLEKEKKIEKILDGILLENNTKLIDLINIPIDNNKYPFDGRLFSYLIQKQNRTEKDNYFLVHYLKFYDIFNNLLVKIYNTEEKNFLFNQIINKIIIEEKKYNDILFKNGDISEKFYFLLKGIATRLKTIQYEIAMNKFEFFLYMKYLYKLDEIKLFNLILSKNEEIFDKYELLYFILEDKSIKYFGDSLKQIKKIENDYVLKRIIPNKMLETNFNNEKKIVLFKTNKTLDDIFKNDNVVSPGENHIKRINISVEEYLENLKPIDFSEANDELIRNKVKLYTYDKDKEIEVGEHLEELDLKKIQKRNSTIICKSNCIFGYFIKKEYISCLKVTQTKFHKNDINFLLSNELFSMLNFRDFDKHYYHLFLYEKLPQKHILFQQGEINNNIYFLRKGEINITFEGSFNDLYRIIGLKGGPKNRKDLDINYIKRFHSLNIDENVFKEKKIFTLFKITENFPIGFEDFIDTENENKILFNAFCILDSEVFVISRENFNEIVYRENEVRKMKNNYIIKRDEILIDKLNIMKNGLIQNYISEKFNIKLELPYLFDDSPLLFKSKKRYKNYLTKPKKIKNDLIKIDTKLNDKAFNEMKQALKVKRNKENYEIMKYKYLNSESNKNCKNYNDYINIHNSATDIKRNANIRRGSKSFKIINIKDFSKKNKINNDILELIKSQDIKEISNSRKKNDTNILDPYEKIYSSLKNDDKNRNTDFSYLNILIPPHPNKYLSKSKKNLFQDKLFKNIYQEKSISKLDTERNMKNKKAEVPKILVTSFSIVNKKNQDVQVKPKIIYEDFKINKFLFLNDKIRKILIGDEIKNESTETTKRNDKSDNASIFPKINYK